MLESGKILHLASANCEWEAAASIVALAAALREHGFQSAVTAPAHSRLQEIAEAAGVEVVPHALGGTVNPLRWLELSRLIAGRNAGVIHAHDAEAATMLSRSRLFGGKAAVVATRHDLQRPPSPAEYGPGVDAVVCFSEAMAGEYEKVGAGDKVEVAHGGVNIALADLALGERAVLRAKFRDDYCRQKEKPLFIVAIAPLEAESRHAALIEAMSEIVAARPQAHLLIMGEGSLAQELVSQRKVTALSGDVTFLEPDKAFVRLLAAADLYVSLASNDISGFMVRTAMAAGTACILPRAGCYPEMAEDGNTGVFIPDAAGQTVKAAMLDLLENRHKREDIGKRARARAAKMFNSTVQAGKVAAVYGRIAGG